MTENQIKKLLKEYYQSIGNAPADLKRRILEKLKEKADKHKQNA